MTLTLERALNKTRTSSSLETVSPCNARISNDQETSTFEMLKKYLES
jgi:hypothetical protein